ncbi:MAG: acyltransferase [Acidobacteriota bacterium]
MTPGTVWRALLVLYFRARLKRVGKRFRIGIGSMILNPENVSVGDDVYWGPGTVIGTPSEVIVGDRVMFGPQVMLIGGDHDLSNVSCPLRFVPAPPPVDPIVIGADVWLGARVIVLKGVRIGDGAVVGAGSVVTKDLPSGCIAVGNPARVLRVRADWDSWKARPEFAGLAARSKSADRAD